MTPAIAGQLTVEVNLPAPGFWNGDTPDTIKDGFEYCMAANIANRLGLDKVGVVNVAWDALVAGQTKNYDLALSQATITDERKKVVDFSVPYFSSDIGVLVKKGTAVDAASIKGLRIGVQQATTGATFVDEKLQPDDAGQGVPRHDVDVHGAAGQPDRRRDDGHRDRAGPGVGLGRPVRGGRAIRHRRDLRRHLPQGLGQRRHARPGDPGADRRRHAQEARRRPTLRPHGVPIPRRSRTSSRDPGATGGRPARPAAVDPQAAGHHLGHRPGLCPGRDGGGLLGRRGRQAGHGGGRHRLDSVPISPSTPSPRPPSCC